jgi:hypothetical protein
MSDPAVYVLSTPAQYRTAFEFFLENYSIPTTQRRRLMNASTEQLRRFMMTKEDFGEWVWEKHIQYAGEPWKYHIKTYSFVKDELYREVGGIKIRVLEDGSHNMNVMNKYECYALDTEEDIDADEIYFVRFEDLDNEIYWAEEAEDSDEEDEELKAEVEADALRKEMKANGVSAGWAEASADINGDIANSLAEVEEIHNEILTENAEDLAGKYEPRSWTAGKKIQMVEEPIANTIMLTNTAEISGSNDPVIARKMRKIEYPYDFDTDAIAERMADELEVR